jgi:hypothetical protein
MREVRRGGDTHPAKRTTSAPTIWTAQASVKTTMVGSAGGKRKVAVSDRSKKGDVVMALT